MGLKQLASLRRLMLASAFTVVAVATGTPTALAADSPAAAPRTVSVAGAGQAKGKPTIVEMSGVVTGEAELAADATVKFRDAKRRALKAIENLKIASLSVSSKGVSLNQSSDANAQQMMFRGGQPPTNVKQMVQVSEQLQLILKDADKQTEEEIMATVLKVVDAARDAGLSLGSGGPKTYQQMIMAAQFGQSLNAGLATFKIPNAAPLRAQAYERAMEDARTKAQKLAELSGAKLGKVVSVQEQGSGSGSDSNGMVTLVRAMMNEQLQKSPDGDELSSGSAGDITLNVTLSVQFALE